MPRSEDAPPNHRHREQGAAGRDWAAGLDSPHRSGAASDDPDFYAEAPPVAPPSYAFARLNHRFATAKPSTGKRMLRTIARFCLAVAIGVGGTLAWQAYGDQAKAVVRSRAPSLAWLLPAATVAPPAATVTLPQLAEQLKSVSLDLVVVRRALEQIAAKSDQLAARQVETAQNVATLRDIEQDVDQRIAAALAAPAPHAPPHRPPAAPSLPLPGGQPAR